MDFYETVNTRHTVRDFKHEPIDDATVERIIGAAMKAPSNDYMRDWNYIVIKDITVIHELLKIVPDGISEEDMNALIKNWNLNDPIQQEGYRDAVPKQYRMLADASCVIIPLFQLKCDIMHPEDISQLNGFASIWCSIENLLLAATAEGYGTALRIARKEESDWARKVLNFPANSGMPCFIAVGKPTDDAVYNRQVTINLKERIHKNVW